MKSKFRKTLRGGLAKLSGYFLQSITSDPILREKNFRRGRLIIPNSRLPDGTGFGRGRVTDKVDEEEFKSYLLNIKCFRARAPSKKFKGGLADNSPGDD